MGKGTWDGIHTKTRTNTVTMCTKEMLPDRWCTKDAHHGHNIHIHKYDREQSRAEGGRESKII